MTVKGSYKWLRISKRDSETLSEAGPFFPVQGPVPLHCLNTNVDLTMKTASTTTMNPRWDNFFRAHIQACPGSRPSGPFAFLRSLPLSPIYFHIFYFRHCPVRQLTFTYSELVFCSSFQHLCGFPQLLQQVAHFPGPATKKDGTGHRGASWHGHVDEGRKVGMRAKPATLHPRRKDWMLEMWSWKKTTWRKQETIFVMYFSPNP